MTKYMIPLNGWNGRSKSVSMSVPNALYLFVDRYAERRAKSRSAAFTELLCMALDIFVLEASKEAIEDAIAKTIKELAPLLTSDREAIARPALFGDVARYVLGAVNGRADTNILDDLSIAELAEQFYESQAPIKPLELPDDHPAHSIDKNTKATPRTTNTHTPTPPEPEPPRVSQEVVNETLRQLLEQGMVDSWKEARVYLDEAHTKEVVDLFADAAKTQVWDGEYHMEG